MKVTSIPFLLVTLLLQACGGSGVEVMGSASEIQSLAIISISANRGIRSREVVTPVVGIASKVTSMAGDTMSDAKEKPGDQLLKIALEEFATQLSQVQGWNVVPYDQIKEATPYKDFTSKVKKLNEENVFSVFDSVNYIALPGSVRIPLEDEDGVEEEYKAALEELAKALKVDGVAVIDLDLAYDSGISLAGYGTAIAAVGVAIYVVTADGDEAIVSVESDEDEDIRQESDESIAMVMGQINFFDDDVRKMLKESIQKGAAKLKEHINEEL